MKFLIQLILCVFYGGYCGYLLAYFNQNIPGWAVFIILGLNAFVFAFLLKFITNTFFK